MERSLRFRLPAEQTSRAAEHRPIPRRQPEANCRQRRHQSGSNGHADQFLALLLRDGVGARNFGEDRHEPLTDLAAVGSLLSGVAVTVTLIFLVIQMRQNTKALASTALDSGISDYNSMLVALAGDPALVQIIRNCLSDLAKQPANDQFRFDAVMSFFLQNGEYLIKQRDQGVLDAQITDQQLQFFTGLVKMKGGQEWWAYSRPSFHPLTRRTSRPLCKR